MRNLVFILLLVAASMSQAQDDAFLNGVDMFAKGMGDTGWKLVVDDKGMCGNGFEVETGLFRFDKSKQYICVLMLDDCSGCDPVMEFEAAGNRIGVEINSQTDGDITRSAYWFTPTAEISNIVGYSRYAEERYGHIMLFEQL